MKRKIARSNPQFKSSNSLKITLIYFIIGFLWIKFSDQIILQLSNDAVLLSTIQTYKGWFFVIVTSLILYLLIKKSTQNLIISHNLLNQIVETVPVGITFINNEGQITFANKNAENVLGLTKDKITSRTYNDPEWKITSLDGTPFPAEQLPLSIVQRTGNAVKNIEYVIEYPDGKRIPLTINASPIKNIKDEFEGIIVSLDDITERKRAEEKLKESEEKLYKIFHNSPDAITISRASDGLFVDVNESFYRVSGYTRDEVIGYSSVDLNLWVSINERDKYISALGEKKHVSDYETSFRIKNGEVRSFILAGESIELKGEVYIIVILHDNTDRKKAEEEIKKSHNELRSLSAHLQIVREEERKMLAREMHDEIGQILTSIKMNLSLMKRQVETKKTKLHPVDLDNEIKSMSKMIDHAVVRVRKMITELRPELLDKLGLIPALDWYITEFERETKIISELKFDSEDLSSDKDKELTIFRIVQETLTNVARHSKAKKVTVDIRKTETEIVVEIIDNGIGISEEKLKGDKSFGLLGMRERANLVGGKLKIIGVEGKRTTVKLVIGIK